MFVKTQRFFYTARMVVLTDMKLELELADYTAAVLYIPLTNEINYRDNHFPFKLPAVINYIPTDKNTDPIFWAKKLQTIYQDQKVFVLIPGTAFDMYGTRHGKGGGWYDRFLESVPKQWLRIGVTDTKRFSCPRISKKPWDQAMDWMIIFHTGQKTWKIYRSLESRPR